jgi:hypothetical protein
MKMKKMMSILLAGFMVLASASVGFATSDIGAGAAKEDGNLTLEDMLEYAIEDEYMAKAEYEYIIEELDGGRPFTNIVKAEDTHIEWLKPLFEKYDVDFPEFDSDDYLVKPDSIESALELGVDAEVANIAMYESFLKEDLPEDVEKVFEYLKRGSENHLKAFERGTTGNFGQGRTDENWKGNGQGRNTDENRGNRNNDGQRRQGRGQNMESRGQGRGNGEPLRDGSGGFEDCPYLED